MKIGTKPPILESTYGIYEVFRKLGFQAEDIYVVTGAKNGYVHVQVRQGELKFNFAVDRLTDLSPEQFNERWKSYATDVNEGRVPEAELARIYQACLDRLDTVGLMWALGEKGISIPVGGINARARRN